MKNSGEGWPITEVGSLETLVDAIYDVPVRWALGEPQVAWRGMPSHRWELRSTLDRLLRRRECPDDRPYEFGLRLERRILEQFCREAEPYSSDEQWRYLDNPHEPLLSPMMLGRHFGLPTRILDWTHRPEVAAYFACVDQKEVDGVIWWFDQGAFEVKCGKMWDQWGVPKRIESYTKLHGKKPEDVGHEAWQHRDIGAACFRPDCQHWISKVHPILPFRRLEAQWGFMSICGRLLTDHDAAINALDQDNEIKRGRIVIPSWLKMEVVVWLRKQLRVTAERLEFPGVDLAATAIAKRYDPRGRVTRERA